MNFGIRCSQKVCGEHAAVRYTWPGEPEKAACIEHAEVLKKMADCCGFNLTMYPLSIQDHIDMQHLDKKS
jgi:hypothetical protein